MHNPTIKTSIVVKMTAIQLYLLQSGKERTVGLGVGATVLLFLVKNSLLKKEV
jgi:hypothetical protein